MMAIMMATQKEYVKLDDAEQNYMMGTYELGPKYFFFVLYSTARLIFNKE